MQINHKQIKRILLVRNDRFGEFLLNIPAFRAIDESFPGAKITLVINPYCLELAQCIEVVDERLCWENRRHKLAEVLSFARELRNRKIDLCVIFNPSKEFNLISFLARIPIRIGYNRKLGFLLTRKIKDLKHLCDKHEVEYNLELVSLLGVKTDNKVLSLKMGKGLVDTLSTDLRFEDDVELIAIHPFTSDPLKQWPLDNFRSLAKRISRELKRKVVVVGGGKEVDKARHSFDNLDSKVINIIGKTSLLELAAFLKRCRLLVSGDSGPVHLACAVGVPAIAIFRNDIPGKCATRWGPWGQGHSVIESDNLTNVSVEEVFNETRRVLNR